MNNTPPKDSASDVCECGHALNFHGDKYCWGDGKKSGQPPICHCTKFTPAPAANAEKEWSVKPGDRPHTFEACTQPAATSKPAGEDLESRKMYSRYSRCPKCEQTGFHAAGCLLIPIQPPAETSAKLPSQQCPTCKGSGVKCGTYNDACITCKGKGCIQPPAPPAVKVATPRTDAIMGQFRLALRGQTSEECIARREAAESGIADLETELAEAKARLDTVLTGNEPGGLQDWMDQATQARIQNVALDERCERLLAVIRERVEAKREYNNTPGISCLRCGMADDALEQALTPTTQPAEGKEDHE